MAEVQSDDGALPIPNRLGVDSMWWKISSSFPLPLPHITSHPIPQTNTIPISQVSSWHGWSFRIELMNCITMGGLGKKVVKIWPPTQPTTTNSNRLWPNLDQNSISPTHSNIPPPTPPPIVTMSEVQSVVVDNGSGMCKAGFSGDDAYVYNTMTNLVQSPSSPSSIPLPSLHHPSTTTLDLRYILISPIISLIHPTFPHPPHPPPAPHHPITSTPPNSL